LVNDTLGQASDDWGNDYFMIPANGMDPMKSMKVIARMFGLVDLENSSNVTRNIHSFFICPPTPLMATIDCPYDNGPRKPVKILKPFVRGFKSPVRLMKRWSAMDRTGSFLIFNYRNEKQYASHGHTTKREKPVEPVSWEWSHSR